DWRTHMTRLRKISLVGIAAFLVLAVIGTLAVAYEQWALAAASGYLALLLTVISIFLGIQFLTHNISTSERNAKTTTQKLAARINVATHGFEKSHGRLQRQARKTDELIRDSNDYSQRAHMHVKTRIDNLEQT